MRRGHLAGSDRAVMPPKPRSRATLIARTRACTIAGVVVVVVLAEIAISMVFAGGGGGGGATVVVDGADSLADSARRHQRRDRQPEAVAPTVSVRTTGGGAPLALAVGGRGAQGQAYCRRRLEAALTAGGSAGRLKLPRVVAFPVLGGGFRAEKAWREAFREAGFDTAPSPDVATIIISKQWRFDRLPGGALCGATQMFNHIPGAMAIVNKAQLVASLHRLGDSLGPALRDEVDQLMPESYIMADKGECARFVDRHVFCQFVYTGCIP